MTFVWRLLLVLGLSCAALSAEAANCSSFPYTLTNSTTADANQVMANFNNLLSCGNNNLAHNGANSDITSLSGLTTPLSPSQGGSLQYWGGTSTGSANAQTITTVNVPLSLAAGMTFYFHPGFTNTGALTLNVDNLGATSVLLNGGTLPAAAVAAGGNGVAEVVYDGASFELISGNTLVNPTWFGAKNDAQELTNCTITARAATVACSGHTFVAADVGKVAAFYLAGATVSGERNATLITTIASISAGNAVLTANASNTVASAGIFTWFTDDTTALNAACAATPPPATLALTGGYGLTGTFNYGNGIATTCHDILGLGNPTLYFAIGNHTADGVDRQAFNGATTSYVPMSLVGGLTIDCLDTGLECLNDLGGYKIFQENVTIQRAYRDGWARTVDDTSFVQQMTAINTQIVHSGLNGILNWSTSTGSSNGFIDEIGLFGLDIEGWSENGTGLGVSGAQLGAAIYSIASGPGQDAFMEGHKFYGAIEFNSLRAVVVGFGSDINPNAVFFADGRQPHVIFGTNPSALQSAFRRWTFDSPQIEDTSGGSATTGADFAGETTALNFIANLFNNVELSGAFPNPTINIGFGVNCAVTCGNVLSVPNNGGNASTLQIGANVTIGGTGQPFITKFVSNQEPIPVSGTPLQIAHGLGVIPTLIYGVLHCVTGNQGYTAGEEIPFYNQAGASPSNSGLSLYADATNIYVAAAAAANINVVNPSSGAVEPITAADWTIVLKAVE